MKHRHLADTANPDSVWAVEDVLARGHLQDWRELAARVLAAPSGQAARSLAQVLGYHPDAGTVRLWAHLLASVGGTAQRPPARTSHLISLTEAAQEAGLSSARLRLLAAQGRLLGARKIGRSWVVPAPVRILPSASGRGPKPGASAGRRSGRLHSPPVA